MCGIANTQAHHHSYSEPYNVHWLCALHHVVADHMRRLGIPYSRSTISTVAAAKKRYFYGTRIGSRDMLTLCAESLSDAVSIHRLMASRLQVQIYER